MTPHTISRRTFLKYCGSVAAALGLSQTMIPQIAEALTSDNRPPVLWLHFSECTGCSESFLRAADPDVTAILLDVLNVTYHETIQVACGEKAEYNRDQTVLNHAGEFICIVEGSIPTADNGVYGMVGGRTMLDIAQSVIPHAKHTIAFGTCAAYGGLAAAAPNPTGAKGVKDAIGVDTINITGCPPHPVNLVACVTSYLLNNRMPALRSDGRPTFCHGQTIHASCTVPHGCLQGYNCKGPRTYNNCHKTLYNQESWCVQAEHQCIGCSEPNFWDTNAPFYNPMWASMFHTYRKDADRPRSADHGLLQSLPRRWYLRGRGGPQRRPAKIPTGHASGTRHQPGQQPQLRQLPCRTLPGGHMPRSTINGQVIR
jgi:[NiFe] hydrogenase small subunit